MTVGQSIFATIFSSPKTTPSTSQNLQKRPKGYPLDIIFGGSGSPSGNVKTMVSCKRSHRFHGCVGSQRPLVQHFVHNVFKRASRNGFFLVFDRFGLPRGSQGKANERPTKHFFGYFSHSASFWIPGDPRVAKIAPRPQKYFKKYWKMTPK